ncbi:MAG: DUF4870 domain-containing protein [Flavobacteriaceae bacterium]|nr:DUF4870 domain-containing protein [Flavobacteriaceae bacterium]
MRNNNENSNAFLIHISAFAGYIFPFGSIIAPLILWQTQKDKSKFLDEQGKEAVNFNISYALYTFLLGITVMPFVFSSIFRNFRDFNHFDFNFSNFSIFGIFGFASIAGVIAIIKIALIIIAALKSKEGEDYRYPLTIKFIK